MLVDSTSVGEVLKLLDDLRYRPAEVRTAGSFRPPVLPLPADIVVGSAGGGKKPPPVKMSAWLADTMEVISASRACSQTPNPLLEDAERAAALIVGVDPSKRPQLNILSDGRPSFATSLKDFYLHLTIDRPGHLTWFATANNQEYFGEDVVFDGRRLPQEIRQLLSA